MRCRCCWNGRDPLRSIQRRGQSERRQSIQRTTSPSPPQRTGLALAVIGPGLLVAATGVGAGDLATAGFAGARLGPVILWAVILGALMKYVLTEALARWQLASGQTLIDGVGTRLGRWVLVLFVLYLLPWTWIVSAALLSATGAATQAMVPLSLDPTMARVLWASIFSFIAVLLAWRGGFKVFRWVMSAAVIIMVAAVVVSAAMVDVDWAAAGRGLVVPEVPAVEKGLVWTLALIGGVGGTVTMLCYGYWIKQSGRDGPDMLSTCRVDLASGYIMTALFGVAMVIIASGLPTQDGKGVTLIVSLADTLQSQLGGIARWVFLIGAWSAIVSSLLGVWQAVPMIFADAIRGARGHPSQDADVLEKSPTARITLVLMASLPLIQVVTPFETVQLIYATVGAIFLPMLAIATLLLLRTRWCGALANGPLGIISTVLVLCFFVWMATL